MQKTSARPTAKDHERGAVIVEYVAVLVLATLPFLLSLGTFADPVAHIAVVERMAVAPPQGPLGAQ
jgi:hypothetical protein